MQKILDNPKWQRAILAGAMVVILIIGLIPVMPLKVTPSTAPQNEFSAERAMSDLLVVAAEPHFMGSAAQGKVRDYLVSQIEAAGATAEVQSMGSVTNIVVTLPGSDPTGKVMVTGHYDAAPSSPGAGDDGVSTVAMLESIRVLQALPQMRNDLVFLFADGEEAGLLGSSAFLTTPLAKEISMVLAFDAWPGHGPTTFQQTSEGDEWLARNLAQVSPPVYARSTGVQSERDSYDSDFDALSAALIGMEFENNGDGTRYHTPNDTVDGVDPSLVQSQGETMLSLVNHFASIDLGTAYQGEDYSFFSWPIISIVAFPYWVNLIVSGLALATIAAVIVVGWLRGRKIKLLQVLVSAAAYAILLFGLSFTAKALWGMVIDQHPEAYRYSFPVFEGSGWVLLGFMLVAGVIFITLMSLLSRYTGVASLAAGTLIAWEAFCFYLMGPAAFNAGNPLKIEFIAWSLLGGAGALAVITFVEKPGWKIGLLAVSAIPAVFMLSPTIVLSILKPTDGALVTVMLLLVLLGLLLPQLMDVVGAATFKNKPQSATQPQK